MPLSALSFLLLALPSQLREPAPFPLEAAAAVVLDAETGKVLYARDPDTPRYPASTTKIMTTLLLLERTKPGQMLTAPKDVTKVPESSMHLKPGERISSRDLAYALMLRSANDGCYTVAVNLAGSVPKFSAMMNARARELGCQGTYFNNPNGLNDRAHLICARDLALIAREAMRNPEFAAIARTRKHKIVRQKGATDLWMISKNRMLATDPSADGIKTGWTIPSGHTYVGSATRGGRRLITAILNSPHWGLDHQNLLEYGFSEFSPVLVARKGARVGAIPVRGGSVDTVAVGPKEDVNSVSRKGAAPATLELSDEPVDAPVRAGNLVGKLTVTDSDGFRREVDMVALEDVDRASLPVALAGTSKSLSPTILLGGALVGAGLYIFRRPRRSVALPDRYRGVKE